MIYRIKLSTDTGRTFYIDTHGGITGLFAKQFSEEEESKKFCQEHVLNTFSGYKVFIECQQGRLIDPMILIPMN